MSLYKKELFGLIMLLSLFCGLMLCIDVVYILYCFNIISNSFFAFLPSTIQTILLDDSVTFWMVVVINYILIIIIDLLTIKESEHPGKDILKHIIRLTVFAGIFILEYKRYIG